MAVREKKLVIDEDVISNNTVFKSNSSLMELLQ